MSQPATPAVVCAQDAWDHVTVTCGVGPRTYGVRDLAVTVTVALVVAAATAWIGSAVIASRAGGSPTATSPTTSSHATLGPVVRLGVVARP